MHTKPVWKLVVAVFFVVMAGATCPLFGWFVMESMTRMNIAAYIGASAYDEVLPWCGAMLLASAVIFLGKSVSGVLLTHVTANVVQHVREDLY